MIATVMSCGFESFALDASHYAEQSALASGQWVKIRVGKTGMYLLTNDFLRNQGFSDPSKVNVYGFGGRMAPDVLDYTVGDDLPLLPVVRTSSGIVFYATDNITWSEKNRHTQHGYCSESYYFLSDRPAQGVKIESIASEPHSSARCETFTERLLHEIDLTSPANTGRLLLGEDFRSQTSQTFSFSTPDIATSIARINVVFGAKTTGSSSSFKVSANGSVLNGSGTTISAVSSAEQFIRLGEFSGDCQVSGSKLDVKIDYKYSGTLVTAALDYIEVTYGRQLKLPSGGSLPFSLNLANSLTGVIKNATAATQVWDVTIPHQPVVLPTEFANGEVTFPAFSGYREYVAFTPDKVSASPSAVGQVGNQNIHGMAVPDMVIITPYEYWESANKIAKMRREVDGMKVHVFTPEAIYNEFSCGSKDVGAFRKMLKMFVDRAKAEGITPTRFCLIWGKPDYNFKTKNRSYTTVPIWLSPDGVSQSTSYSTDHYIGMVDDCTTFDIASADILVAVGRLPVKSVAEAETVADKIVKYVTKPDYGSWRNQMMILADDNDGGVHLDQAEKFYAGVQRSELGDNYLYERIYCDSYPLEYCSVGAAYPKAKKQMLKLINDGCAHFTYIGHSSTRGWGHEQQFSWSDIVSLRNKRLPFIYAATCEFGRWDNDDICGGEHLLLNDKGGVVGLITPSRTVYITNNGMLTNEVGKYLFKRGADGRGLTVGESFIAALNAMTGSDDNKLRYCIISDPALHLPMPERTAAVHIINDVDVTDPSVDFPVVPALGNINVKGEITRQDGTVDDSFNGVIVATLYDAESVITTFGNGDKGVVKTYNDRKTKLLTDKGVVVDGKFDLNLFMPAEIDNNWSPALLNLYAYSKDGNEANGSTESLYLYGFNDDALVDTEGPVISRFTLNNDNFRSGDKTHRAPLVLASLSDPSGINLSDGGIGHRLTLVLDERTIYDDLISYFSSDPFERGAGELVFSLPEVEPGKHTLKLVAWDNVNNSSSAELEFIAELYRKPNIYDVTTDVNPAKTSVNFIVSHDQTSITTTFQVDVYDLSGRKLWAGSTEDYNTSGGSITFNWDLTDLSGSRVPKGIYLYRATVRTADGVESSKTKRLIVSPE